MRGALVVSAALCLLPGTLAAATDDAQLLRAAPLRGDPEWSPRRLFNAGLVAEERGNTSLAVQLYMSARLAQRQSYADDLYARGAGLRLVRILAGYDDDAAAAAAMLVNKEAGEHASTDLAPLIRSLLRRFDQADAEHELTFMSGTIASIRLQAGTGRALVELKLDSDGDRRVIMADGPVGPFSAGDQVRLLARRASGRAAASLRLIAMSHIEADGWQILAVSSLPGEPGPAYGALVPGPKSAR